MPLPPGAEERPHNPRREHRQHRQQDGAGLSAAAAVIRRAIGVGDFAAAESLSIPAPPPPGAAGCWGRRDAGGRWGVGQRVGGRALVVVVALAVVATATAAAPAPARVGGGRGVVGIRSRVFLLALERAAVPVVVLVGRGDAAFGRGSGCRSDSRSADLFVDVGGARAAGENRRYGMGWGGGGERVGGG